MHIRAATHLDAPDIEALRDRYYASHGEPVQSRPEATWWVAEHEQQIVAVQSYDQTAPRECYVMDSYTDGTSAGARGLAALSAHIAERADDEDFYLLGLVHMEDDRMLRHSIQRGWQISGVLLARAPQRSAV